MTSQSSPPEITLYSPQCWPVFPWALWALKVLLFPFNSEINPEVKYVQAAATEIDVTSNTVNCVSIVCEDNVIRARLKNSV